MKLLNKIYGIIGAVSLLLGATACTEEVEYTPAELQNARQAYFPSDLASQIDLTADATSFTIELSRMVTGEELTVDLTASDDEEGLFSVPATATFAADADKATITIGYDPAKFTLDVYKPLTISLANNEVNPYASNSYSFQAGIPAPYNSLGRVQYRDDFIGSLYTFGPVLYEIELQENSVTPGMYRMVNPYGEDYPYSSQGEYDNSVNHYIIVDATDPDAVLISYQNTGLNLGQGNIMVLSLAANEIAGGATKEEVKAQGICGKLENGIITFPVQTLFAGFEGESSVYYANLNGAFALSVDPDIEIKDYSIDLSYAGQHVDEFGKHYAVANVEFGADVEYAQLAIIQGYPDNSTINAIIAGDIPSETVRSNGEVELACATTGYHSIVAVTYGINSGEEEASVQEAYYVSFRYATGDPIPMDYYIGNWVVNGYMFTETDQIPIQSLATISKADDTTLMVQGLAPFTAQYDDTFLLKYEQETGNVIFDAQALSNLNDVQMLIVPSNLNEGLMTTSELLLGQANEYGELIFQNDPDNEGDWTDISVVAKTAQGVSVQLMYDVYWTKLTETSEFATSSITKDLSFNKYLKEFVAPVKNEGRQFKIFSCDKQQNEGLTFKGIRTMMQLRK